MGGDNATVGSNMASKCTADVVMGAGETMAAVATQKQLLGICTHHSSPHLGRSLFGAARICTRREEPMV